MAVVPIQWLSHVPMRVGSRLYQSVASNQNLLIENAKFRAQNLLLQAKVQQLLRLSEENKYLRGLLDSNTQTKHSRELVGRILMVDPQMTRQQVIVDKGSLQKVYVGQPVLDGRGVFGQVIDVTPLTSRVLLLNDASSAIPVENSRTHQRAIAIGRLNHGLLTLIHLTVDSRVEKGDRWVASGLGLRFPAGYPVGVVVKITKQSDAPTLQAWLAPSARLNQAQQVLFIWPYSPKVVLMARKQLTHATSRAS